MAESWLTNKSRFCVAPNGDYQGNDDTCYWGLPSIEASDPAYPALGYWVSTCIDDAIAYAQQSMLECLLPAQPPTAWSAATSTITYMQTTCPHA